MCSLQTLNSKTNQLIDEMRKVILGQDKVLEQLVACFLAGGHVLIEGVPGLGKTLLSRTLARLINAEFRRIQFTPDLLPSDITGTNVFDPKTMEFLLHKGPIFTEVLFADEVNRTPPKTQAALLEAMEERQVTIDGVTNPLPELFFVIATQNPVEYEGVYPLPETQLDRFMMKLSMDYPPAEAEMSVIRCYAEGRDLRDLAACLPQAVLDGAEIAAFRGDVVDVIVEEPILRYITQIIIDTRDPVHTLLGASTRAGVAMVKASKALAAVRGMRFVSPDDVKDVSLSVLRHRVILRPEALIDGLTPDQFLGNVLRRVAVPR